MGRKTQRSMILEHPRYKKIAKMLLAEKEPVRSIAKKFDVSKSVLFRVRNELRKKKAAEAPEIPKSTRLRSEAKYWHMEAQRRGNDPDIKRRAAMREKEADDLEDTEDFLLCLDERIGESDDGDPKEPRIRDELNRLDLAIKRRLDGLADGARRPQELIRFMAEREVLVQRFREVLEARQEWRRFHRGRWKEKIKQRLAEQARAPQARAGTPLLKVADRRPF